MTGKIDKNFRWLFLWKTAFIYSMLRIRKISQINPESAKNTSLLLLLLWASFSTNIINSQIIYFLFVINLCLAQPKRRRSRKRRSTSQPISIINQITESFVAYAHLYTDCISYLVEKQNQKELNHYKLAVIVVTTTGLRIDD